MPQKKNRAIDVFFSAVLPDRRVPDGYTTLKYSTLLILFLYFLSYLIIPFSNGDPAYYTILGRGIIQHHLFPYNYAFDHKPLGVNLFYGLWDWLIPFYSGKFAVLALVLSAAVVCLCRTFGDFSRATAFMLLTVGGAIFNVLSGNSEIVLVTGETLCLTLMFKGIQNNRNSLFFLAGIVAAFTVNINYLSVVCLVAPAALLLFSPGWFRLSRCFLAVAGGLSGLLALFSPYLLAGHGALQTYFSMQHEFLHRYSGSLHERLLCLLWMTFYVLLLSPVLIAWCRRFPLSDQMQNNRKNLILPLWFFSSLPATMLSGHPFEHYFQLCFAPAAIMWAILLRQGVIFSRYALMPFFVVALFFVINNARTNFKTYIHCNRVDYAAISREVGQNKVLSLRAYHSVFYLSNLWPFDIYLFSDHTDIMYGAHAEQHFMEDLQKRPPYVVMRYNACGLHEVEPQVCEWVQQHYKLIYAVNVQQSKPNKFSVALYKLAQPVQVPATPNIVEH